MSYRRQRVGHGQHEIELFSLPVLEPLGAVVLALRDERVELLAVFDAPAFDERRVDRVAEDVAVEPGVEREQEAGEAQSEETGGHAGVVGLAPAEGQRSCYDWRKKTGCWVGGAHG